MKRYEVIISSIRYERFLTEAEGEEEAAEKVMYEWNDGGPGELLSNYDANAVLESVEEAPTPTRLPIVEIRGVQYYKDDRLKQYRNVQNPYDWLPFGWQGED